MRNTNLRFVSHNNGKLTIVYSMLIPMYVLHCVAEAQ